MSYWIEIKDREAIEIDGDSLEITLEPDKFGNNYVVVPLEFIKDALMVAGYKLTKEQ